jgi:hypothetical protein
MTIEASGVGVGKVVVEFCRAVSGVQQDLFVVPDVQRTSHFLFGWCFFESQSMCPTLQDPRPAFFPGVRIVQTSWADVGRCRIRKEFVVGTRR